MQQKPSILIINGSFSEGGLSASFAENLALLAQPYFACQTLSVRTLNLPNFDYPARHHPQATELKQAITQADGVFIISPEYHGCISGALKNTFDYLNDELDHKPVGIFATSGSAKSGVNALNSLRTICRALQANVLIEQAHISKDELEEGRYLTGNLLKRCQQSVNEMRETVIKNRLFAELEILPKLAVV